MFIRHRVSEFDDAGSHAWTWYVDVPEGMEAKPDSYRYTRHKGMYNISEVKKHNMDSPTVKMSGVRDNVEMAMRLYFGGRGEVWHDKGIKRTEVYRMGKVTRDPSRQTKRLTAPLHVISMEIKAEILTIGLILDDDVPVRYAAEVRMSDCHRFDAWKILMYRRLNPRSHGKPEYGLRVMPAGTSKAEPFTHDPINFAIIDDCLCKMRAVIPAGTKAATTLEILARQTRKQEALHWGSAERGKNTISYRIFSTATPVCDALRTVMTNPTPDNVAHWTSITETIKANMATLGPKFEARLHNLEAEHFLRAEARKQQKEAAKHQGHTQAPQSAHNAFIPPMPPLPTKPRQTPSNPATTPATGTSTGLDSLTAFLNPGSAPSAAPQPAQRAQTIQQAPAPVYHNAATSEEERDVTAWLASIPKDAPAPPVQAPTKAFNLDEVNVAELIEQANAEEARLKALGFD